jgi:hypothetical protein
VPQLCARALGSLLVASYDSQGCGGHACIITRLTCFSWLLGRCGRNEKYGSSVRCAIAEAPNAM